MTMSSSTTSPIANENEEVPPPPKKAHTVTVCMVPSPEFQGVWKTVSEMRQQLKDPGYYRWPPHANLLYPFLELEESKLPEILEQLHSATRQCPPFNVSLNQFGTFGGNQRGVLWLFPDSSSSIDDDSNLLPPLVTLQEKLEEAFSMCKDQTKGGSFSPHMTMSHFKNLDDALAAQEQLESDFPDTKLDFVMDRVYLLERKGDSGQFLRVAEVGLGSDSIVQVLDPPQPFPGMPAEEEDWVHEERMKLKARRNRGSSRGVRGRRSRPSEPRVPDTPDEIARKRAERKAKRERLERE